MHPLEKKVRQAVAAGELIGPGTGVLVAVSAGPDSMALLHALAALRGAPGLPAFSLAAAYVDHGLRPAETGRELELVAAAARRLAIPWRCGRVAVRELAVERGLSLEHAARELRYRFLAETAAELAATCLAVAHTADDQAEELLLRLIRGTARKGLSGMARWRQLGGGQAMGAAGGARLIRPLLAVSKAEVLAYLADRAIAYAEDSSNRDRRFLRNRVRLELLPQLVERFNPNIRETLCHTARVLADEEELLAEAAAAAYRQVVEEVAQDAGEAAELVLDLPRFQAQPAALRRRLLEQALLALGLQPAGRQIQQLMHGAARPGTGVIAHLAAGVTVRKDGLRLRFLRGAPGSRSRRGGRERQTS